MRAASPALIAFLDSAPENVMPVDLYQITLRDGTVLRWTGWEDDVEIDGAVYKSAVWPCTPTISRTLIRSVVGFEVGELEITIGHAGAVNLGSIPMGTASLRGAFDKAGVRVDRLFMPTPGDTSLGTSPAFIGDVAGIDPSSTSIRLTAKSAMERLNLKLPQNLFAPDCIHAVYDPGCGLNRADWTVSGTIASGSTTSEVLTDRTEADGYFDLGVLTVTSGLAAGSRRSVRSYLAAGGTFRLVVPLPAAVADGDTFEAYPGCMRDRPACRDKFNNLVHFRGFPFVPKPERTR